MNCRMRNVICLILLVSASLSLINARAQHADHHTTPVPQSTRGIDPQPLLAHAIRLQEALGFLGSSLSEADETRLQALQRKPLTRDIVGEIENILDPYCLARVNINPEARVKVERGSARATLVQGGWVSFLIKVNNEAGITAQLNVQSKNAAPLLHQSTFNPRVIENNKLTSADVANRFLEMQMYRNRPMLDHLSGLKLEYAVLQVYSKDAGQREVELGFNVGQGTQDIGFRNLVHILFDIKPSVKVVFRVKDYNGAPAMASFTITDGIERVLGDTIQNIESVDYRLLMARLEYVFPIPEILVPAKQLKGIYPLPSRRVAAYDEYPDFFFQPQVYRSDGEHVLLPAGTYTVTFNRGPEYLPQKVQLTVPEGSTTFEKTFQLKRWVNMARLGWYSADHHVHAAGCSHYESPEEGVKPLDMWRQALGEDLNVAAVLAWGPSWYHQKTFFTGQENPLSTTKNIMRYDVEVSGFPSSHAGHIVLLRLKEDDYPGTSTIEDWPAWTMPVLRWAKSQDAVTGYAHSGWGLEPSTPTNKLPNYITPKMDGIGANEYIVAVTQGVVDFYSAGNTPAPWELNMWYHTLNCGFTPRLSGETDFPCIFDERIGLARSYFKPEGPLTFDSYVAAIKNGRSYVSDGSTHIIDFSINGKEAGTGNSRLLLQGKQVLNINARVNALLPEKQQPAGAAIANSSYLEQPYWHLERARMSNTRKVRVELIANGFPVDTTEMIADGTWKDITFKYNISSSAWLALRVYPSAHSNPLFVEVDGRPIRDARSAEWCLRAVDQCWKMKQSNMRPGERAAAQVVYDEARKVYRTMLEPGR